MNTCLAFSHRYADALISFRSYDAYHVTHATPHDIEQFEFASQPYATAALVVYLPLILEDLAWYGEERGTCEPSCTCSLITFQLSLKACWNFESARSAPSSLRGSLDNQCERDWRLLRGLFRRLDSTGELHALCHGNQCGPPGRETCMCVCPRSVGSAPTNS